MAEINIEIDPKNFEKFATDILNAFRKLETELRAYQLMFEDLAHRSEFAHLPLILNTMRRSAAVRDPVNHKYDLALNDIRKFVRGSIPDDVFLRLMKLIPPTAPEN